MGALIRVILPAINHKLINIKHHVLSSPRDERHINQMIYNYFKNSLIIHEENTKKNHKRVASLYVDKDFPSFT
jgi:hypothetical protein